MRSADLLTIARVLLAILVAYLVIIKFDPIVSILLFAIALAMDGLDGFAALHQISNGRIGFLEYMRYVRGRMDKKESEILKEYKLKVGSAYPYGPRMDVAGDRIIEYTLWALFTFLHVLPLFVIILIIARHSFADAFMAAKGTSSRLKTRFARIVYGSNASRAGINIMKFVTFSYLILVYVSGYPILIGYVLAAMLVAYILARGAAEINEALHG